MIVARGDFHGKNNCGDEINFGGYAAEFTDSVPNLSAENGRGPVVGPGNWNEEISSWRVATGQWQFFEHAGYGGLATKVYGPGECLNCVEAGFSNKWISSIRKISD
jgi:hypothetical protein